MYLLLLGFNPVAVGGRLIRKIGNRQHKRRSSTQNNRNYTKSQNTQNIKKKSKTKTNKKY